MYFTSYNRRKPKRNYMIEQLKNSLYDEQRLELNEKQPRELSKTIRFKVTDR